MAQIQSQLASIAQYLKSVWYFDTSTSIWYFYDPLDPTSTLSELGDGKIYYIYVTVQCTLSYSSGGKTYLFNLTSVWPAYNTVVWNPTSGNAPKARILSTSLIPAQQKAGTLVVISVTLINDGPSQGVMSSGVYSGSVNLNWESGSTNPVNPGYTDTVLVDFTMPAADVVFDLLARHKDPGTGNWITDQVLGPITIQVAPSGTGPQHPVLVTQPTVPANAKTGDPISISLDIKNDGGAWGAVQGRIRSDSFDTGIVSLNPDWLDLYPYPQTPYEGIQVLSFTMPNQDVSLFIELYHWNYDSGMWVLDYTSDLFIIRNSVPASQFQWVGQTYS